MSAAGAEIVALGRIWDKAPHNAFTDLIRFRDRWYCAFREGAGHATEDGKGRIIVSDDGEVWTPVASLQAEGDVRDPKLCLMPDGRLMAVTAAALYRRQPGCVYEGRDPHQSLVWVSRDGSDWGMPIEVGELNWWLWRVTWHKGVAYGVGRRVHERIPRLYRSTDGVHFEPWVERLFGDQADDRGSEASLLFLPDDRAVCLIRGHGPTPARIGHAEPPYRQWQWLNLPVNIGGPQLMQLPDGRIVVGGRHFGPTRETWLWWLDAATGRLDPIVTLPSGGDTSYPGLVFHDGLLWVSYYSSHEGKASIYLARVRLPQADTSHR
jgi:hypothetical protein